MRHAACAWRLVQFHCYWPFAFFVPKYSTKKRGAPVTQARLLPLPLPAAKPCYFLAAHGFFAEHGFVAAQGFFAAQGFGLNFFCKSPVYAVNAASWRESQGSGLAAIGTTMQNCTISSSCTCLTPPFSFAIATGCGYDLLKLGANIALLV